MMTENGYLAFKDQSTLNNYLESLQNLENNQDPVVRSAHSQRQIPGFRSIAMIKKDCKTLTRTTVLDEEVEEMSQDEYNAAVAADILIDPLLTHIMDTTLRLQVGQTLYQVTPTRTYYTRTPNPKKLKDGIKRLQRITREEFNQLEKIEINPSEVKGRTEKEYAYGLNGVYFIENTLNTSSSSEGVILLDELPSINTPTPSVPEKQIEPKPFELHLPYNTETFQWKNNSVWQKNWDGVRGKKVERERNYDKKHRIQVEVFNVNYLFYTSAGIQVKMQKRKKFIFINYWVSEQCEDLAIGFNFVDGTLTLDKPASYREVIPYDVWGNFQSYIKGQQSEFIYHRIFDTPFVKDWIHDKADGIYEILPRIHINLPFDLGTLRFPTPEVLDAMYNAPYETAKSLLSTLNDIPLGHLKRHINIKDPRTLTLPSGTEDSYTQKRSYITGVVHYPGLSHKTVRFNQSFGISFTNGHFGPYLPSKFKMHYFDGFGAVRYKGKWLGIRFISNSKTWK